MTDVRTDYEYLTHNDKKIIVDAAIRDGDGYKIASTYPRKISEVVTVATSTVDHITINHTLGNIPSVVQLYILNTQTNKFELYTVDVNATSSQINIDLSNHPLDEGTTYYVKALI